MRTLSYPPPPQPVLSDTVPPSEAGLKLDAEASLQFIMGHAQIDKSKVFLFGRR